VKKSRSRDPLADELCTLAMDSIRAMKRTFPEDMPARANDRARLAVRQHRAFMTFDIMAEMASMLRDRTLRSLGRDELPPGRKFRHRRCIVGRTRSGRLFVTAAGRVARDLADSGHLPENGAGPVDPTLPR